MPSGISLVRRKFGRLTVIREVKEDIYLCRCSCLGTVKLFRGQLSKGVVRHCGCQYGKTHKRTTEHCHCRFYTGRDGRKHQKATGEYMSYWAMKNRCLYRTTTDYPAYGGRGIVICGRWLAKGRRGFLNFIADMGPRPIGKTLDRIDVQAHYTPSNCRWADQDMQISNRRNILFPDGDVPPVADVPMDLEAEFACG